MVERHTYRVRKVKGHIVLTYEDQDVTHRVEHRLVGQPSADAQKKSFYRNMPHKESYEAIYDAAALAAAVLRPP